MSVLFWLQVPGAKSSKVLVHILDNYRIHFYLSELDVYALCSVKVSNCSYTLLLIENVFNSLPVDPK